jgi:hypothetical protein
VVEVGADRDHQLDAVGDGGEGGGGAPSIQSRLLHTLDVVEVQLRD